MFLMAQVRLDLHHRHSNLAHKGNVAVITLLATSVSTSVSERRIAGLGYISVSVAAIAGPGAHDLLKILLSSVKAGDQSQNQQQQQQQTMLLPFVKEFVPSIDEENRTIHICPPPGLLELAVAPPSKGKKGSSARNKAQK